MAVKGVSSENLTDVEKDAKDVSPKPQGTEKRKRGRPRKNGVRGADVLGRTIAALNYFHEARRSGLKYESALWGAARRVNCSTAEIKRVLAEFQPHDADKVLITGNPRTLTEAEIELHKAMELDEVFWKNPIVTPLSIGSIPTYPRHNAREKA